MRVSDARGDGLAEGAGGHELGEVPRRPLVGGDAVAAPRLHQPRLHALVQDEVDHRLAYAHVGGRYALVEAFHALRIEVEIVC